MDVSPCDRECVPLIGDGPAGRDHVDQLSSIAQHPALDSSVVLDSPVALSLGQEHCVRGYGPTEEMLFIFVQSRVSCSGRRNGKHLRQRTGDGCVSSAC